MSNSIKHILLIAGLVVGAVLILSALSALKPTVPVKQANTVPRIPVAVTAVTKGSFQVALPSQGLVQARTRSRLASQVSGNVVTTNPAFEVGGSFKRGDVLVTVDDADYQAALKIAQANVNQARVALKEEQARGKQAIRDWERLGFEEQASDLVKRLPQLQASQAALESAEAQLEKAALDLSRTRITAPYDGRVISDQIDAGNFVNKGQVLGDIVEAGALQVELPLSASWRHLLDWSGQNNKVHIQLPNTAKPAQWTATISNTSADISEASRQFKLLADIDLDSATAPSVALFIGDYVDASVAGATLRDVAVLPRQAIYDDRYVWTVIANKLIRRDVSTVWLDKDYAVVDDGLEVGALVVTTALGGVMSGTAVRLVDTPTTVEELPDETSTTVLNGGKG